MVVKTSGSEGGGTIKLLLVDGREQFKARNGQHVIMYMMDATQTDKFKCTRNPKTHNRVSLPNKPKIKM